MSRNLTRTLFIVTAMILGSLASNSVEARTHEHEYTCAVERAKEVVDASYARCLPVAEGLCALVREKLNPEKPSLDGRRLPTELAKIAQFLSLQMLSSLDEAVHGIAADQLEEYWLCAEEEVALRIQEFCAQQRIGTVQQEQVLEDFLHQIDVRLQTR